MTIHNLKAYTDNLWDWAILDGCFGQTRISPTDIDALIERHKKFLLIEAKSPHKPVPTGQKIIFDNLLKSGLFTVIVVWGSPNKPESMQVWGQDKKACTLEDFRKTVSDWYRSAERNGKK